MAKAQPSPHLIPAAIHFYTEAHRASAKGRERHMDCVVIRLSEHFEYIINGKPSEMIAMAKATKQYNIQFVNINLTSADKKEFKQMLEKDSHSLVDMVTTSVERGHKFSVRYDKNNDSFAVFTSTADETNVNYGTGFSTRAGDPFTAIMLAAYKVMVVCDGGLWENEDEFGFE